MLGAVRDMASSYMRGTIVIYDYAWASDSIGGGTASYTASGTVYGNVAPAPYRWAPTEGVHQDRLQDAPYYLITLPYSATVTTNSRLMSGSTTYEVMEVNNDPTDIAYIACKCTEIV